MRLDMTAALGALLIAVATSGLAGSFSGASYSALDLLSPCQEADNDARWGEAAETECEQYIMGFADALREVGMTGPDTSICPPELNTADEIRWAFMRWVHADFSARKGMSAADALLATLRDSFACSN
ncbi:MAG: Rap1a/Tai family immunity protein [Paracoccaceae bacterium]